MQNMVMPNYDSLRTGDYRTPGGISASADSSHPEAENDPFLNFLEQLAENDGAGSAGPYDLNFYVNGQA